MEELLIINWIILGIEIFIGLLVSSVFFTELFPFLELRKITLHYNEKFDIKLTKTFGTLLRQFFSFIGNFILIAVTLFLVLNFNNPDLSIPDLHYFIVVGLLILIIPKFVFTVLMSPYWTRQLKYFVTLTFIFLPLFFLDRQALENIDEISLLYPSFDFIFHLFLPSQLLLENGIEMDLASQRELFIFIFLVVPFSISLLYQIIPKLIGFYHRYSIYEWKDDEWIKVTDDSIVNDNGNAILLLHGLGVTKEDWSYYSKERNSARIVDYIRRMTAQRYDNAAIYALDFSDKLKNSLSTKYNLQNSNQIFGTEIKSKLNNYEWELLLSILLLKHEKNINRVHLVGHSTGGVISRQVIKQIYTNPEFNDVAEVIGKDKIQNSWQIVDKVSWLAVPHFGAKGASKLLLSNQQTTLIGRLIRLFFLFPPVKIIFNWMGKLLITFGLDAQATHDLDPKSKYIKKLNKPGSRVNLYGYHEYKNAYAINDSIVGEGSIIDFRYENQDLHASFDEEGFNAVHFNPPWQQYDEEVEDKEHKAAPIHHAHDVIHWIFHE